MNSPRERQLAVGLRNKLLAIQKSEQIYKELSKWEKRTIQMDENEIDKVSKEIAAKVEKYYLRHENAGKPINSSDIKQKIREELEKI